MATNGTFSNGISAYKPGSFNNLTEQNIGLADSSNGGGIATHERELTIGETPTQQKVPNGQTTIATNN
jgi:hypothetical protein